MGYLRGMRTVCVGAALVAVCACTSSARQSVREGSPVTRERLEVFLDSLVDVAKVPGIAVGVSTGERSLAVVSGWADTIRGIPLTPDDLMLQGSVGKTYFAAVALQLVSEGLLGLDDPVITHLGREAWFERLPNASEITVRQLMGHTSGIVRYELNPAFLEDLRARPMRTFTPVDRMAYLLDREPPFEPGEGWEYSDSNYILLAMIIEELTGAEAYDEIRRRLLEPLGLKETVPSDQPSIAGLANGYAGPGNPFGDFDATVEAGRMTFNPQFEWGGGGFASSADDLAEWIRAFHEGDAFAPELLEQVRDGRPAPLGPGGRYGLATIMLDLPTGAAWGHSGYMPGYRTEAYYFPDHGFAVALQINTSDGEALQLSPLRMLDAIAALLVADEDD